jgi:AAA+ ATPase superfamily predicted ATPase
LKEQKIKTNPFIFGKVVHGENFINRKDDRRELILEIKNHTNIILYAPRRYGKTSLILQVFEDIRKKHKNFTGIFIDFYRINSREKFLVTLTGEYAKNSGLSIDKILTFLKSAVKGIIPSLSLDQNGNPKIDLQFTPDIPAAAFEDVVNLPKKLADNGKLVCVVFDEFQEVTALNGKDFQNELRSVIQHHNNVSYFFSGSKQHLIQQIFNNTNNSLYNIGKMKYLHKIPKEEFTQFITTEIISVKPDFNKNDASSLYNTADGISYYVQMLAHEFYNISLLNKNLPSATILESAKNNLMDNKNEEFLFIYENLNLSQKKALELILENAGRSLFRQEVLAKNKIASATLKKALSKLIEKGIISFENNHYCYQDIFFKHWLIKTI